MRAGPLRHRPTLQAATEATDSFGKRTRSWSDVGTVWARVEPLSGRELERARAVRSDVTHRITTRGRVPLAPGLRLLLRGRAIELHYVLDLDERRRELVAYGTEVALGA